MIRWRYALPTLWLVALPGSCVRHDGLSPSAMLDITSPTRPSSVMPAADRWPDRLDPTNDGSRGIIYDQPGKVSGWVGGRVPNGMVIQGRPNDYAQIMGLFDGMEQEEVDPGRGDTDDTDEDASSGVQFEPGGSFVVRLTETDDAGTADSAAYFVFVSAENELSIPSLDHLEDSKLVYQIQRTWFTYRKPPQGESRGVAVLMPGIYGTPREVVDRTERALGKRGWSVVRMLAPPSRMTVHTEYEIPTDGDASPVLAKLARDLDNRAAECAYAVDAAVRHVAELDPSTANLPKVLIGMSGTAITLPTVWAYAPDTYSAAVIVAGGANSFRIARLSSYDDWIDAVRITFPDGQPTQDQIASFERTYLDLAPLDSYWTAQTMRGKPVLVIHGRKDTAVPADTGELLWKRLGEPERWSMPVGHELIFVSLPLRLLKMMDWLDEHVPSPEAD
ncbi:MAG TPA: alpha/beta hydrolase [Phycisphaerales bacterium]|nr:alpha/beta hydrolase [Phycisphaerales bacterium]